MNTTASSKRVYKSPNGEDQIRTVIAVNVSPPLVEPPDDWDRGPSKTLVGRTLSHRSSGVGNFVKSSQGRKLGHRRVGDDGEITYKKFETTQLIGSIQLGLQYAVGSEANVPDRDLLLPDFMSIETVSFTRDGLLQKTPAHNYSEFRFRIYASHAFRVFRRLFEIDTDLFLASLCSEAMVELSGAGASGSIFYVTRDDNFICKTVQHKEAEFLQKLLPGYYMNLKQNPRTLLPKFFGLYCYSSNAKNVRILVMNNLLPSGLKMHQKFDLKGSTYKRKASKRERDKSSPTYKDLDFMEMYPDGIHLQPELYQSLMNSIQRDCRVLESFKIMDYSLLIGVHNVEQAAREATVQVDPQDGNSSSNQLAISDNDSSSTGTAGNHQLERQGSFQMRERMIAHSTALESITMEADSVSIAATVSATAYTSNYLVENTEDFAEDETDEDDAINNVWGGIPAKNKKGEKLLLFIGIIDILQSYHMMKKMEHFWKSLVHDGDTVSVHQPGFYARRFQNFLSDRVFKKAVPLMPTLSEAKKGTTFMRNNLRRTLSKDQEQRPTSAGSESNRKESTVTVIRIGDGDHEVNWPYVLQDRGRPSIYGNWAVPSQSSTTTGINSVVVVNADVTDQESFRPLLPSVSSPAFTKIAKAEKDELHETSSVITMTSDERVQIFVPSPQGTPYSTITKSTSSNTTMSIGAANLAPLFIPQRMPTSESFRSLTPINMAASGSPARENAKLEATTESTILQETTLEMVKISLVSSSLTSTTEVETHQTDQTLANDIESLPLDQEPPVSLSHIELELQEETTETLDSR